MNIYYTAKDIEELVAKGIYQLELGPNTSLTDFARETAEQLDVKLVEGTPEVVSVPAPAPAVSSQTSPSVRQSYNKPRGCQAGVGLSSPNITSAKNQNSQADTTSVNRLVDVMGKIINRGD
jgi:hypothetical protein